MSFFADVVRFRAVSTGTGSFVVSSAILGYQTPASGQMVNNQVYKYRAESDDLTQWECGYGVYTSGTVTLSRLKVLFNSLGTTAAISFNLAPQVAIVACAEDVIPTDGALFGLTMSTAGASTTLTVGVGWCADSNATVMMRLPTAMAKTTSAWAVGTAAGGLDTGAIAASTWYHFYVIQRPDTGAVDVTFSLSGSFPTLPTNYNFARRIGSAKTNGSSQWTKFSQRGNEFLWDVGVEDGSGVTVSTTAVLQTLSVPLNIQTLALVAIFGNVSTVAQAFYLITSPDSADTAPTSSLFDFTTSTGTFENTLFQIRTNTSSQIRIRCSITTGGLVNFHTSGWYDDRGQML